MEFMPVFGALSSVMGMFGGGEEKSSPAPVAQAAEEREVAGKADPAAMTAGDKQKAAVRNARADKISGGRSLSTRSGVNIVGGA